MNQEPEGDVELIDLNLKDLCFKKRSDRDSNSGHSVDGRIS